MPAAGCSSASCWLRLALASPCIEIRHAPEPGRPTAAGSARGSFRPLWSWMPPPRRRAPDRPHAVWGELSGVSPQLRQNLRSLFGHQVAIDGEMVRWQGGADDAHAASDRESARRIFAGSSAAFGPVGLGDDGASGMGADETEALLQDLKRRWSVEISAVASGRKPLFHEDVRLLSSSDLERFSRKLQSQPPRSHCSFPGRPSLRLQPRYGRYICRSGSTALASGRNRDNGLWLGYGTPTPAGVRVDVIH